MRKLTRRRALRAVGVASVAALAGCADATAPTATSEMDTPADSPEPMTDESDTETDRETPTLETTVHQANRALTGPSWDREDQSGYCALYRKASEVEGLLDDADEATESFVADTDFDAAVLLYIESVGPNSCYDEIEFSELGVEDGVLTGNAASVDTSEPGVACQDVITYAGAFVRVQTDARVRSASLRVSDGWGGSSVVSSGVDVRGLRRVDEFGRDNR